MKNKSDKDTILTEIKKTTTRLQNKGVDLTGTYFGVNEKVRSMGNLAVQPGELEQESYVPEGNILWKPEDEFIKIFPDELNKIAFNLTGAETLTLIRLLGFIDYESGMLKKPDKSPLLTTDIIKITGFSKVTVIDIMENMVLKRIYSRNKVGRTYQYFANPYIFFKGKYINKTLIDMFKDYRKPK
jgi:hypothetical protein